MTKLQHLAVSAPLLLTIVFAGACSSAASACSTPTPSPVAGDSAPVDERRPDANDSDAASAAEGGQDAGDVPVLDASPPSTSAGLFMAVQGTPPPAPGKPTPFILVGCPAGGFVETHLYLLTEQGKVDRGRYVATYEKRGVQDHIELSSAISNATRP